MHVVPSAAAALDGGRKGNRGGVSLSGRGRSFDRRGNKSSCSIVAASPPSHDSTNGRGGAPFTRQDLVAYLASGCKPKEHWRIGTEHEMFGFQLDTLQPMTYDQIRRLLEGLAERFEWLRVMEGDNIIGLTIEGQSVSLEHGDQFELSGAPLETLHQTCAEVNSHLYQVKSVAEEMGLGFAGIGFQPKWKVADGAIMPKVNLDFDSEEVMLKNFRVGLALQPIATALFANSPFTEGKPNGFLSFRSQIWTDVDKNRSGDLPFVFEDGCGFEKYVDYALDVLMYFVYRNNQYVDCSGLSFKDFMAGKLPVLPGEKPTLSDWENHLTTIFPEVRLKRYLEMRGADGGPRRRLCALPAFWTGLLCDEESLQSALNIISDWTEREHAMLRFKVPKQGLNVPFRDGLLKLQGYLQNRKGVTPAEQLLELYHKKWDGNVDPVFEQLLY